RYNGGGLVRIADELGDYLGGRVAGGLVFSETLFNQNNSASNSVELFQQLAQSMNLSRLVVITTRGTASASELVINSMEPHAQVQLVGTTTFGKPVGQIAVDFCSQRLRPTAFETVNSLGQGQYFQGLPVDCVAEDDITFPVGDVQEDSTATALELLATGSCPVQSNAGGFEKTAADVAEFRPPRASTTAQATAYAY
ncbi:MAG: S41 family peptidase, partial [Pseudomonadota bacterium]